MKLLQGMYFPRRLNFFTYLFLALVFVFVLTLLHVSQNNQPFLPTLGRSTFSDSGSEVECRLMGPLQPGDSHLIDLIRRKFLVAPTSRQVAYHLRHDGEASYSHEYKELYPAWMWIDSILRDFYPPQGRQGGFFVEAGAMDGEYLSNSLRLEMEQGWTGLLVEPDKDNFKLLREVNRKAWLTPTCLALHSYPESVVLSKLREGGKDVNWLMRATTFIIRKDDATSSNGQERFATLFEEAQCFPTQSLLMAINVSHVDFFSLDIEKVEEPMLDHFPFDQITVDVWAIEHRREEILQRSESDAMQNYTLADLKKLNIPKEIIEYREQLIREFEDQRFIKIMIARGYYYFDSSCAYVGDYVFLRKASELYKSLRVPSQHQNRTEICKEKLIHASSRSWIPISKLRDQHHYPSLRYRDL